MSEEKINNLPSLYLIDGNSYIYRAFYALPHFSTAQGLPTNAIYGFTTMLFRVIKEDKPDFMAIIFDVKGATFRHEAFAEYKSNRPAMPDELVCQIPYIKRLVNAMGVPLLEKSGYEADDLIGTIVEKMRKQFEIFIITGDKDAFQLIGPNVRILREQRQKERMLYDEEKVRERYGIGPETMVDLIALMGDKIDNIPGIPGIGEKTGLELLKQYGNLENILAHAEEITRPKLREKILEYKELAQKSKFLATINRDVPIDINREDFTLQNHHQQELLDLLKELEFSSLLRQIPKTNTQAQIPELNTQTKDVAQQPTYYSILSEKDFEKLLTKLKSITELSVDLETTHQDPMRAHLVGISLSFQPHQAFYIPINHHYLACPKQLNQHVVLEKLRPILESKTIKKIGQNIKYDYLVLGHYGIELQGISFDTMIASYLLNPNRLQHNLESIALEYLGYQMLTYKELVGSGKNEVTFDEVEIEKASFYSCEDADLTYQLSLLLSPKLTSEDLSELYSTIELPLIKILAHMERNGVKINTESLATMSFELDKKLHTLSEQIFLLAGERFNIDSPKQLAYILFEKLGLPVKKRTKTGLSTNVEVLTQLAEQQYDLPIIMLEYRQFKKLKSTYADSLPTLINPKTGRIHTSFNQTVTATGRLSSSNPNLQNIPIRTELGKRIRESFVAEAGANLLSADYSQIELRILAHLSQDPILIESFLKGEDIHTRTACEIFSLPPDQINGELRRRAKVINFGIIYGMSPYGLAKDLNIDRKKASDYIEAYFQRYAGVKDFLDQTIQQARQVGYVTTLFHRKRHLPELESSDKNTRQMAERMAINTPVQGTAADLIKIAMIHIFEKIKEHKLSSKMILQIHDELLFEVPEEETSIMQHLVKEEMEQVIPLRVPLKVELGIGLTWAKAH